MKEPGKKMGSSALKKLDAFFNRYNIKTRIGKKIREFNQNNVVFEDNSKLESDLIIYIPGGSGHPVLINSELPTSEAGFINIDDNCKVIGFDNVYAIGDSSALQGPSWVAKQGHIAEVMADVAVFNIHNSIINNAARKGYQHHLNIICVMDTGDGAAFIYRKEDSDMLLPLPIIGHWLKKLWGFYYKNSKLGRIPRIPGM